MSTLPTSTSASQSKSLADTVQGHRDDARDGKESANEVLFLEDLRVGDRWLSDSREVTAEDVADFALLTGDNDPLHSQDGSGSPFGEPVAHGLLGLSMLAGLSSQNPKIATLALVSIADWRFEAPLFFGDTIHVCTEIELIEQHGRRAGRVTWVRQLINQQGRIIQRGQFVTLVSTRARARRFSNQEEPQPTPHRSLPPR